MVFAVSFGTATTGLHVHELPAPSARKARGRPPRTHDCGQHGQLTISQIAEKAGITIHGVRVRLRLGWCGEKLCISHAESLRIGYRKTGCSSPVMVAAVALALAYPGRLPTAEEVQAIRPMTLDNATRWRSAIRDARLRLGLPL